MLIFCFELFCFFHFKWAERYMKVAGFMDFYEVSGFFEIRFDYSIVDESLSGLISILNLFSSDKICLLKLDFSIRPLLPSEHANFIKLLKKCIKQENNNLRLSPFINSNWAECSFISLPFARSHFTPSNWNLISHQNIFFMFMHNINYVYLCIS